MASKDELRRELRDLRDTIAELKEAAKEPIKYVAVTHQPKMVKTYNYSMYGRGSSDEYAYKDEKRFETLVLIRRDGQADTVTFPGKWTLAQIRAAVGA